MVERRVRPTSDCQADRVICILLITAQPPRQPTARKPTMNLKITKTVMTFATIAALAAPAAAQAQGGADDPAGDDRGVAQLQVNDDKGIAQVQAGDDKGGLRVVATRRASEARHTHKHAKKHHPRKHARRADDGPRHARHSQADDPAGHR